MFAELQFVVEGCMNPKAPNYNPKANQDNGSCLAVSILRDNSEWSARLSGNSSLNGQLAFPNQKVVHGEIVDLLGKLIDQRP
jgi:hypothetical protein